MGDWDARESPISAATSDGGGAAVRVWRRCGLDLPEGVSLWDPETGDFVPERGLFEIFGGICEEVNPDGSAGPTRGYLRQADGTHVVLSDEHMEACTLPGKPRMQQVVGTMDNAVFSGSRASPMYPPSMLLARLTAHQGVVSTEGNLKKVRGEVPPRVPPRVTTKNINKKIAELEESGRFPPEVMQGKDRCTLFMWASSDIVLDKFVETLRTRPLHRAPSKRAPRPKASAESSGPPRRRGFPRPKTDMLDTPDAELVRSLEEEEEEEELPEGAQRLIDSVREAAALGEEVWTAAPPRVHRKWAAFIENLHLESMASDYMEWIEENHAIKRKKPAKEPKQVEKRPKKAAKPSRIPRPPGPVRGDAMKAAKRVAGNEVAIRESTEDVRRLFDVADQIGDDPARWAVTSTQTHKQWARYLGTLRLKESFPEYVAWLAENAEIEIPERGGAGGKRGKKSREEDAPAAAAASTSAETPADVQAAHTIYEFILPLAHRSEEGRDGAVVVDLGLSVEESLEMLAPYLDAPSAGGQDLLSALSEGTEFTNKGKVGTHPVYLSEGVAAIASGGAIAGSALSRALRKFLANNQNVVDPGTGRPIDPLDLMAIFCARNAPQVRACTALIGKTLGTFSSAACSVHRGSATHNSVLPSSMSDPCMREVLSVLKASMMPRAENGVQFLRAYGKPRTESALNHESVIAECIAASEFLGDPDGTRWRTFTDFLADPLEHGVCPEENRIVSHALCAILLENAPPFEEAFSRFESAIARAGEEAVLADRINEAFDLVGAKVTKPVADSAVSVHQLRAKVFPRAKEPPSVLSMRRCQLTTAFILYVRENIVA